jgi:hypothetical protein
MTQAEVEKLVTILPPLEETVTQQEVKEQVRQLLQDVCNRKVDRAVEFPYLLMVHAPTIEAMRLLLLSDHTFRDGYSSMVDLHDLLCNLSPTHSSTPRC